MSMSKNPTLNRIGYYVYWPLISRVCRDTPEGWCYYILDEEELKAFYVDEEVVKAYFENERERIKGNQDTNFTR